MKQDCSLLRITQRARSDAQKALREQQILDAAADLFASRRYVEVALADVAAATGITKAALYRYFRSKEALFLALYRRELLQLSQRLAATADRQLTQGLIDATLAQPLFCQLTAILQSVLEAGLSEEEARDFKQFLYAHLSTTAQRLAQISGSTHDDGFAFLLRCQQALIGCWHSSHPSKQMASVIARPPLTLFQRDFGSTLREHIDILLRDFLAHTSR